MRPIDLNDINDYPKFYFGGFWRRAGALFLDLIALMISSLVIAFIIAFVIVLLFTPSIAEHPYINTSSFILGTIISTVYYIAFVKIKGATPGKLMCKLKVVKIDHSPITWMDSFLRYAPYLLLSVLMATAQIVASVSLIRMIEILNLIWVIASIICLLRSRQRRALHDLIAKTAVIKV